MAQSEPRRYTEEEELRLLEARFRFLLLVTSTGFFTCAQIAMIERAVAFAAKCHASVWQRRKNEDEPYLHHPLRVATAALGCDSPSAAQVAAAILHDVPEDTNMCEDRPLSRDEKLGVVGQKFGPDVALIVDDLTEVTTLKDGNRAQRKAIECAHTAKAQAVSQNNKLLDIDDNATSFMASADAFSLKWMREKVAQAAVCTKADGDLYEGVYVRLARNVEVLERKLEAV